MTRQLGVNWQALGNIGRIGTLAGGPAGLAAQTFNFAFDRTVPSDRIGLGFRTGNAELRDINAVIDALAQDRLVTILAEPNLTATSGETASFLAGGEFPIPVSQRENQVTIEFKQFGVGLAFVPTVLSDGRISFRIRSEVSELSEPGAVRLLSGNNNTVTVPGLTVRRAETTVELGSGQAFAIAGLLQDSSAQERPRAAGAGGGADPRRAVPLRPLPAQRDRTRHHHHAAPGAPGREPAGARRTDGRIRAAQ